MGVDVGVIVGVGFSWVEGVFVGLVVGVGVAVGVGVGVVIAMQIELISLGELVLPAASVALTLK